MVEYASENGEMRNLRQLYKMARDDLEQSTGDTTMDFCREFYEEGAAHALQEGMQKGIHKVARKMLEQSESENRIRDFTDLHPKDFEKLIAEKVKK